MLKKEAENVASYYKRKKRCLLKILESKRHPVEIFDRGGDAQLNLLLQKNDVLLERMQVMSNEDYGIFIGR